MCAASSANNQGGKAGRTGFRSPSPRSSSHSLASRSSDAARLREPPSGNKKTRKKTLRLLCFSSIMTWYPRPAEPRRQGCMGRRVGNVYSCSIRKSAYLHIMSIIKMQLILPSLQRLFTGISFGRPGRGVCPCATVFVLGPRPLTRAPGGWRAGEPASVCEFVCPSRNPDHWSGRLAQAVKVTEAYTLRSCLIFVFLSPTFQHPYLFKLTQHRIGDSQST